MQPPLIFGPVPAYSNPPIEPQFFKPSRFVISAITLGQTTTITTTENNNYVIGQVVRLLIPNGYGSRQLNEQQGIVISIPSPDQVVVEIDSSIGVDAFIDAGLPTQAQIIPIGDVNTGALNTNGQVSQKTYVPGSFRNISPL